MAQSMYVIVLTVVLISSTPMLVHPKTLEADTRVLRAFKNSMDPNTISRSSFLHSWNFNIDPCESSGPHFLGIICAIPLDNSGSRITSIDLDGIGYEGFLTPDIGNLTELVTLNLSKNKFRGPIPQSISKLRKLVRLSLSENFFTGSIPLGISRLRKMESIDLSQNKLLGSIPSFLSGLRSLTNLKLSGNGFSGRIPDLSGLWQLVNLDISSNQLIGNMPKLPISLRSLSLNHNLLSGYIYSIERVKHLRTLDLSDNRFSGVIRSNLLSLPRVTNVNISFNRFTMIEVTNLSGRDMQLEEFDARENHLQGHLPVNLVTIPNLRTIDFGHNQFSGQIPAVYGEKAKSWKSLFLDYNYLIGSPPPSFRTSKIRGSFANNCLKCSEQFRLCHDGQRPASECGGKM